VVTEFRARRVWPTMLLTGIVVAFVFSMQMELLPHQKQRIVGGLLWLAILFAGLTAIDRSFASERADGCWDNLKLYPVSPTIVYLAKLLANIVALGALQCLLIPLFALLADLPLLERAWQLLLLAVLGNLGLSSVGTLLSALATAIGRSGNLLALMVLPLVIPVVLAAAEATYLLTQGPIGDEWWRWIHLLAAFAVIFMTAGVVLFEFAIED
jgi:heme exporter protein B